MSKEFFSFDTVKDFDSHIKRQILEYSELDSLVQDIAVNFIEDDTNVYDLGCSTGRMLSEMSSKYAEKTVRWVGIENNENFTKNLKETERIRFLNKDLRERPFLSNASMVLSIFTLQFLGEQNRIPLLESIYSGLNRGGALFISEKVYASTSRINKVLEMRHWDKKGERYTPNEVLADEKDLRDVMKPLTLEENLADLKSVGFKEMEVVWRFNNFVGILCIK